ncbi:MAG TPA: hypothetical protein VKW04_20415 [Planctomycetota bacterium]|nr:hypothetical protein [Planctomycetota bacterium]
MNFGTLWHDGIGFWRVWVLSLGKRHGLFDGLRKPAPNEAVRLWRDAAVALELLTKDLRPAPGVRALILDRDHPEYLAGPFSTGPSGPSTTTRWGTSSSPAGRWT